LVKPVTVTLTPLRKLTELPRPETAIWLPAEEPGAGIVIAAVF
jgi:hypothetical protein